MKAFVSISKALLAAACFAAFAPAAAAEERSLGAVMSEIAAGGHVILMRHANSPSGQLAPVGLTEGCVLQEGRGLDAKGFFQARFIGEFFKTHGVRIDAGFTSDLCRAWDTARLVAAGAPVDVAGALKTTKAGEIDVFKAAVAGHLAASPGSTVLLVSHSNIVPLYADWGGEGEIPSGVVLIVDPESWTVKERLNLDIDLAVE